MGSSKPDGDEGRASRRRRAAQVADENTILPVGRIATADIFASPARPRAEAGPSETSPSEQATRAEGRQGFEVVPDSILEHYYRIGHKYFLDNGELAFVNHGAKLSTKSENAQIVRHLVDIVGANGVDAIQVSGTERFRRVAWAEAQRRGIEVQGFTPTVHDEKQLVRAMAREEAGAPGGRDSAQDVQAQAAAAERLRGDAEVQRDSAQRGAAVRERIYYGELVEHGRENYRRSPHEDMSYYVTLKTANGTIELWGKDLERALAESKSRPEIGDEIAIIQTGQQPVTVRSRESDEPKSAKRNRWVIEKREFLNERADLAALVRDPGITPANGAERKPQLAGTYVFLKQAEEFAKTLTDKPKAQQQFLHLVREWAADTIERGEALPTTKLREPLDRTPERERVLS